MSQGMEDSETYHTPAIRVEQRAGGRTLSAFLLLFLNAICERENFKSLFDLAKVSRKIPRYSRMVLAMHHQRKILRMLKDPALAEIPRLQPAFPFKFLHERYLWQAAPTEVKVRCLLNNYGFLKSTLKSDSLREMIAGQTYTVFDRMAGDFRFTIVFCMASNPVYLEGEMSLLFKVNTELAFTLSFTIVPGDIVGSSAKHAILISRLQSPKGANVTFRIVSKALHGITPAKALMDAVQGVAQAFQISELFGLSGRLQSAYAEAYAPLYLSAYDEFFRSHGMTKVGDAFFRGIVPLEQKPVTEAITKATNRSRGKHRRELRKQIFEAVDEAVRKGCQGNARRDSPSSS
jgi:uncharacterized protein VirK/YbjX